MKKVFTTLLVFTVFLMPVIVSAQQNQRGIHEPGTGLEYPELQEEGQGTGQGQNPTGEPIQAQQQVQNPEGTIGIQAMQQARARNTEQLQTMIQEKQQEMNQELQSFGNNDKQEVYQNQNQVRIAAHALLAAESLVGGIGPQISDIAQQFNNSVQKTILAEEKIQSRGGMARFFFGGDKEAAEEIKQEVNQNQKLILQLKQLRDDCPCQQEVEEVISQQIQNIDQEQNRLQQLAQKEEIKKGLFGWLFGWLSR